MSSAQPWSRTEFPSRPWRIAISSIFAAAAVFSSHPISDAIFGPSDSAVWIGFIVLPPLWILTAVVHEIGHALGAYFIGWRVHLIAVKPVAFRPALQKFGLAPRLESGDIGGFVFATPELFGRWSRSEAIFFVGGAAANLFWGVAALILAANLVAHPIWANVFGGLGLVSLIVGVYNLIPMWLGNGRGSDGALLWDLWKGRRRQDADKYLAWLAGLFFDGVSPRLWQPELVARAENVFAPGEKRSKLDWFLVLHYLSVGRFADARKIFEGSPVGEIPEMAINHAFLLCVMDKNGDRAHDILERVPETHRNTFYFYRSAALAHFYKNRPSEACAAALRAEAIAAKNGMAVDKEDGAILSAIKNGRPIAIQLSSMDIPSI
jgi:hypothetical protein